MAVVIASNLRKEFSGDPLFDGVSFKVERRDRVALAGPNGAGKTTLLRALVGETTLQGGHLAFQKGTRAAMTGVSARPPSCAGSGSRTSSSTASSTPSPGASSRGPRWRGHSEAIRI